MGWVDVKGRKFVEKKGKLASCLLILRESYVLMKPSPQPAVLPRTDFRLCSAQTEAAAAAQPRAPIGFDAAPTRP